MLYLDDELVKIKQFPNGENYIDLDEVVVSRNNDLGMINPIKTIKMHYESDLDLMGLMYLTDHLKDLNYLVDLIMPYIPYSRMDRKEGNRLFTLKSICRLINSLEFRTVIVHEPHSDVSIALLNRVKVENMTYKLTLRKMQDMSENKHKYIHELYKEMEAKGVYLVYPDAGASKRYNTEFGYSNTIECIKERDFQTGRIKRLILNTDGDFKDCKTAIIVDDLCSKGGTFLMTAKELRNKGVEDIYLVVTHCEDTIFEGDLLKTDFIREIITTDSILTKKHPKIKIY